MGGAAFLRPRLLALGIAALLSLPRPALAWELPLQCVPFARALSGITLFGDAWRWWYAAAGRYDRDQTPRAGSILSFRPSLRMPLGHVAVVTRVVGPREIEIDHANWAAPGAISREIQVIDISDLNDWTAVRVELGHSAYFGSVYATNGFIHGRPVDLAEAKLRAGRAAPRPVSPSPEIIDVTAWLAATDHGPHVIIVSKWLEAAPSRRMIIPDARWTRTAELRGSNER